MSAPRSYADAPFVAAVVAGAILQANLVCWALGYPLTAYAFLAAALLSVGLVLRGSPARAIYLLLTVCAFGLMILSTPTTEWDARSIWFFHAKRLWAGGSLYSYLDSYAPWSHNDYPPLLAATAASIARTAGSWNEILPRLSILALILPVMFVFAGLLRNPMLFVAWLASLLVYYVCIPQYGLLTGYMDLLLGLAYSAALLLLADIFEAPLNYEPPRPPGWRLAALVMILSLLPLFKNEGLVGCLIIFLILARRSLRLTILGLAAFLPWLLIWKLPLIASGVPGDLLMDGTWDRLLIRLHDWPSLLAIVKSFLVATWPTVAIFIAVCSRSLISTRAGAAMAGLFFLAYAGIITAAYLVTPYDLGWHLATSSNRTYGAAACVLLNYAIYELQRIMQSLPSAWNMTDQLLDK